MPVLVGKSSNSIIKLRPRSEMSQKKQQEKDIESTRSKLTQKKKLNKTFRGFGCTAAASQKVSLPAVIRSSADWDAKKVKKKKMKQMANSYKMSSNSYEVMSMSSYSNNLGSYGASQDVWSGPGIGFSASDAVIGSVDCVVTTRRNVVSGRGEIENHPRERVKERVRGRERDRELSFLARWTVNPEYPFLDLDAPFAPARPELDVFGPRCYRHVRHPSPDSLADNSLMMGGRVDSHDHFRDWRLDVDNMSYEELLELGDRIGYVSTGLKEDEIGRCLRKLKNSIINGLSSPLPMHVDKTCTICQEEYEADDEMGKLGCGHSFHIQCIKQWLSQKNACPVCKAVVLSRC